MLSIAKEYNLPGIAPTTRVVSAQSDEELARFVGKYSFPELGDSEIIMKENGLEFSATILDNPILILPKSDSIFFDETDGEYFTFTIEGGKAQRFKVKGFEANRIE